LRTKNRSISMSAFLVLAVILFGLASIQNPQVRQPLSPPRSLLIPPPPSAPYWSYKTGGDVQAVAVSQDGGTVVAGSYNGKIYLFGRQDNTTLWTYKFALGAIDGVAVSDNGSTIVAGGSDGYIRAFGRESNTTIWAYKASASINSVAISADGNTIVAGGDNHYVYVFGRQNNATIWNYNTTFRVRSVAVSADGSTIVSGDEHYWPFPSYGYVRVFGRQTNTTLWTYKAGIIEGVAVSANGSTIVAGSDDFIFYVFGRQSNTTIWTYKTSNPAEGVDVSADGNTIAAGSRDGNLTVFARASNATLINYETNSLLYNTVAVSSDGSTIACGGWGSATYSLYPRAWLFSKNLGLLWNYNVAGNISDSIWGPAVGISGDGTLIAYGSDNGKIFAFQYDYTPPVLGLPSASPLSPVGGQSIDISISVTDNVGVKLVNLNYKTSDSGYWSSAQMVLSGDIYTATIGPFTSGANVTYYISASDSSDNVASSPNYAITIGQGIEPVLIIIAVISVVAIVVILSIVILMRRARSAGQGRKTK